MLEEALAIEPNCNYAGLEQAAGQLGGNLLAKAMDQIERGAAQLIEQEEAAATYTQTFSRHDTVLDWRLPAGKIASFVRAWDPDLGATTRLETAKAVRAVKLWRVDASDAAVGQEAPGVITALEKTFFTVQAGSGAIRVLELQPENKARMTAAQFLAGNKLEPGVDRFTTTLAEGS
jgi:methionyl-tRNA formyltransferase